MKDNYIKLNKVRDFGEVFNDTFAFLKQEAKPLGGALLRFVLPLFLIAAIIFGYVQSSQLMGLIGYQSNNPMNYLWKLIFAMIVIVLAMNMLVTTIYCYFKLYHEKGPRNFDYSDLFEEISHFFIPSFLASIVLMIVLFVGFMFCGIPGIYLGVSLSLFFPVFIIEDKNFGDSFARTFELTHKQWWWTLLIILVYMVMTFVFMMILYIPLIIFLGVFMFKQPGAENLNSQVITYIVIYYAFLYLASTLFQIVLHTAVVFQYFNIVEKYEGRTLADQIEQITDNGQA